MDDLEFFDYLYQGWSKTTGAKDTYWMPEEDHCEDVDGTDLNLFSIVAVDQGENKTYIAQYVREEDAAWITALHGCFADLTRRLHQAVDEAERFDIEKDRVISELALAEIENNDLREQLEGYRQRYG
ncbi:hypothetical protein [Mycobacterium intracellulare]|uniref:Uncharacterized protein n=1 Tax=Mycobacterium intracellulare TaxID=1767 RepID=A0A7R7MZ45_MYCIT|nr:hypothetical protein [Mycobacterium intracellulare]BCP02538.1 hypothetical protein MINTM018_53070 [Mycobacterium intracellulare]